MVSKNRIPLSSRTREIKGILTNENHLIKPKNMFVEEKVNQSPQGRLWNLCILFALVGQGD